MLSILLVLFLILLILAIADYWLSHYARRFSYPFPQDLPVCEFALVLGTSKYIGQSRQRNRYYRHRIDAALVLWRAGKVKQFIVSGNGLDENALSETECMQADLVAGGVPAHLIWQDRAGLRTLDSILRFKQQFQDASVCMVSQPFHNQRALLQAAFYQVNAVAYHAQLIGWRAGWRVHWRERFARLRLWYDLLRRTPPQYSINEESIAQFPTQHHL